MNEQVIKSTAEALAEIYRNTQLALQSIANILPEVDDEKIKTELMSQHEEYERFSAKAAMLAKDENVELKEPNPMKKMMMWGSIKMNTLTNNSPSHIADMMLQGTVMGISALRTTLGEITMQEGDVVSLLKEMISMEEKFEKTWKSFL